MAGCGQNEKEHAVRIQCSVPAEMYLAESLWPRYAIGEWQDEEIVYQ